MIMLHNFSGLKTFPFNSDTIGNIVCVCVDCTYCTLSGWIKSTSMAFLIILASNSAGVSISPMISLSRFFDSSDFRSFIRSCGQ